VLSQFWSQNGNPEWPEQRRRFLGLLEEQARLDRMARIVGKDALPPRQQHVLLCAELINEAFLRQSAFSEVDRYCSAARQMAMLKLLSYFIDKSEQAVAVQISVEDINTLNVMRRLRRMGEDIGNGELEKFDELRVTLDIELAQLTRRMASDAG